MLQRNTFSLLLAVVLGTALAVGAAPATASAEGPVRVLLTGDSITHGFNGDYTWRYRLAKEFQRQGVPVDFVGSRRTPHASKGWTEADYADPAFDSDHFALGGSLLRDQVAAIGPEIRVQQPDLVVLACGINDLRRGLGAQQTDANLRAWIDAVRAEKADTRIVLSPVLPATPTAAGLSGLIEDYDALMAQTATDLTTEESPIVLADTTRGWTVQADTYDDIHPTPTGETLIAQRVGESLHGIGVLPTPPDVYRTTAWGRPVPLRSTVSGGRVTLSWDNQSTRGARLWTRRAGHAGSLSATIHRGHSLTTGKLVPGATYEFRMQVLRGRLTSVLGKTLRVRVPPVAKPGAVTRVAITSRRISWGRATRATAYEVRFKKHGQRAWVSRRTGSLSIAVRNATRAKVWAVNAGGRSAVRTATR